MSKRFIANNIFQNPKGHEEKSPKRRKETQKDWHGREVEEVAIPTKGTTQKEETGQEGTIRRGVPSPQEKEEGGEGSAAQRRCLRSHIISRQEDSFHGRGTADHVTK